MEKQIPAAALSVRDHTWAFGKRSGNFATQVARQSLRRGSRSERAWP